MAKEIIKEILLKFKGDSKPLEREVKNVEKVAANLQKTISGGTGGSAPSALSKTLDQYIKQSHKFGATINKDMTKFQKSIQEVATKDLKVLQRQTDDLFRKTENRLGKLRQAEQNIQQMIDRGASSKQIRKQERKASRYGAEYRGAAEEFSQSAGAFDKMQGQMPKSGINPLLQLFGPGAIAAMAIRGVNNVVNAPAAYDTMMRDRLSNQSYVTQQPIQQRLKMYEGDMSMALLAKRGVLAGAASDRDRARFAGGWKTAGSIVGGLGLMAAGTAGLIGSGLLEVGSLGAATPLALGTGAASVAGIGAGFSMMTNGGRRMITGETEKEAAAAYNQSLQNRSDMLIDPKLYQAFREVAPARARFGRSMGSSYDDTQSLIRDALDNRMTVDEMMGTASGLRSQVGSKYAGGLAVAAARSNMAFGTDTNSAAGMLGALAQSGKGGPKQAEKNLEDLMTRAVSSGFLDTGMREEFAKMATAMSSGYSGGINIAGLAESIASNLKPGGEMTKRDIDAAANAQKFMENKFGGEDALGDAVARAHSLKFMRENNIPINRTTLDSVMAMTSEDLKNNSEKYRTVFGDDPDLQKKAASFAQDREMIQATQDPIANKIIKELEQRKKSGVPLTPSEEEQYSSALGASFLSKSGGKDAIKNATPETITALGRGFMQRNFGSELTGRTADTEMTMQTKAQQAKDEEAARRAKDPYSTQEGVNFAGDKKKEADIARIINPKTVADMAKATEEANKKIANAGEINDPTTAANAAVTSMETFSSALDGLSAKINGMSGGGGSVRPAAPARSASPRTQ